MEAYMVEKEINNSLNEEARRVFDVLWNMTQKHEKTTKSYVNLVYDIIDENYKCFSFEILNKVNKLIPLEWCVNPEIGYVFIPEAQYIKKQNLKRKELYDKKKQTNISIINDVTKLIEKNYKDNKLDNHSIMYFFNYYYNKHKELDYNYEQIIQLIKTVIKKISKNYKVLQLDPLLLESKN